MALTTQDGLVAAMAAGQGVILTRASMTSVAFMWTDPIAQLGSPGAGVLAGTNTANGVVPTDATAGCPVINAFTGGNPPRQKIAQPLSGPPCAAATA